MKIRFLRERELVSSIRKEFSGRRRGLILGIGDDAAVVTGTGKPCLLTTDLLIENVHFIASLHPPYYLGRKSLNVNLSDIAAMGGKPRFAMLGLALRKGIEKPWVQGFFRGLREAAEEAGVALIGGDVSAGQRIVISFTILGEAGRFIRRSGARPGDSIFVSGFLGDAAAGLNLLRRGYRLGKKEQADPLLRAFLDPIPQLALGQALARLDGAISMIDTSDGLSTDLTHLCEESGTGAEIELQKLPLSPAIRAFEDRPERLALHGGEDYQLLFTVSPEKVAGLAALKRRFVLHEIGRMTRGKGIVVVSPEGKKRALEPRGYEHLLE